MNDPVISKVLSKITNAGEKRTNVIFSREEVVALLNLILAEGQEEVIEGLRAQLVAAEKERDTLSEGFGFLNEAWVRQEQGLNLAREWLAADSDCPRVVDPDEDDIETLTPKLQQIDKTREAFATWVEGK